MRSGPENYLKAVMKAVLTGDIIRSDETPNAVWNPHLKSALGEYGCDPDDWQVYRGDSFQLLLPDAREAFRTALFIRAALRSGADCDARIAIGIGDVSYQGDSVLESDGEAFARSGRLLTTLTEDEATLGVSSPWSVFDRDLNVAMKLALIVVDDWSRASAGYVHLALSLPEATQEVLAERLGIGQSAVSMRRTRAHIAEILDLDAIFRLKIDEMS
jgi:hypothetical protein